MDFAKFAITPFSQNTTGQLLLIIAVSIVQKVALKKEFSVVKISSTSVREIIPEFFLSFSFSILSLLNLGMTKWVCGVANMFEIFLF